MLECASENGLFKDREDKFKEILKECKEADSHQKFLSTYNLFNQIVNSTSRKWRFTYEYGGPVIIYFLLIIIGIFVAWSCFSNEILNSNLLLVPNWSFLWGALGGVLQGFWCLWQHVNDRCLRKNWFTWFLSLPIMGSVLGALVYLVYFAGFIISTGSTQMSTEYFAMLLCAIAGFSSWWAVELLNSLSEIITIKGSNKMSD